MHLCLNGNFTYKDCYAEQFMNASTGSVAYLGSTISQLWAPPMLGQDKIAELLFPDSLTPVILGNICQQSYYAMITEYDAAGIETAYTWALFGDPSLELWNVIPEKLSVISPEMINISKDSLKAEAQPGSIVTLVSDTSLLDYTEISHTTASLFQGDIQNTDTVLLTVNNTRHIPFIKTLKPFNDAGSFYRIQSFRIYDNNNNIPENKEPVILAFEINNCGNITGKQVVVELSSADPAIVVENSKIIIDSVAGNKVQTADGFRIRTRNPVSDNFNTRLKVTVTDHSGQTNAKMIPITIFAPDVHLQTIMFEQSQGTVPPIFNKDTVELKIILRNTGHAPAYGSICRLEMNDMYIDYLENRTASTIVQPFSSDTVKLRFAIRKNCFEGHRFEGCVYLEGQNKLLNFSAFYKNQPQLIIESNKYTVNEYPFYNYYLSGRTQIIYHANELQNQPLLIDSIGFKIDKYSNYSLSRTLRNLTLKITECDCTQMNYAFIDTKSIQTAFQREKYTLPANSGWVFFNIDDLDYSGKKPLLIELNWGVNQAASTYYDSYSVYAHRTEKNNTAYGYSDLASPNLINCSKYRPDIYISGRIKPLYNIKIVVSEESFPEGKETIWLKIGEYWQNVSKKDTITMELPEEEFAYLLLSDTTGSILQSGQFIILPSTKYVKIGQQTNLKDFATKKNEIKCSFKHGNLIIDLPEKFEKVSLFLTETNGRIVYTEKLKNNHFNKDLDLQNGIYLISLIRENSVIFSDWLIYLQ